MLPQEFHEDIYRPRQHPVPESLGEYIPLYKMCYKHPWLPVSLRNKYRKNPYKPQALYPDDISILYLIPKNPEVRHHRLDISELEIKRPEFNQPCLKLPFNLSVIRAHHSNFKIILQPWYYFFEETCRAIKPGKETVCCN